MAVYSLSKAASTSALHLAHGCSAAQGLSLGLGKVCQHSNVSLHLAVSTRYQGLLHFQCRFTAFSMQVYCIFVL